ncbi:hypothetical protein [Streptomyces sp. NPDC005538]|uniref:hypothetical protein n=1 Tax=Streptomyces sp. NPDC005538 TaxID=3157043 RepID=UPI0033AAA84B
MAGADARLDAAGVSLWLTDWKVDGGGAWSGRRVMALVGGSYAGHLDVYVHPDGEAVDVAGLEVSPDYRNRHLASVMMDALYAAYPTAWINHGGRGPEGTVWWDRYTEPAPERNVHNRPPAEWAYYFDPLTVAAQKARNAYQNRYNGVHGHKEAVYRYGESMETEARQYAADFHEPDVQGPDPGLDELYGGMRLILPPGLHRIVHDSSRDAAERAGLVLDHIGHGSLPHHAPWSTTEHSAFEDLVHEEVFETAPRQPVTHMTFRVLPLADRELPLHDVKATWVHFVDSPGIEVQLAGMSWRSPQRPWVTHSAVFDPPVDAAISPAYPKDAGPAYRARYSEIGDLLPGQTPHRAEEASPYAGREAEIRAMADRLQQSIARRATDRPAAASGQPEPADHHAHQQHPQQQTPRIR